MVARSREHEALSPPDASNAYGGCEECLGGKPGCDALEMFTKERMYRLKGAT